MGFIDHLRLSVRDIVAAARFYDPLMRALGFDPEPRDHYAVFFRDPDGHKLEVVHVDPS